MTRDEALALRPGDAVVLVADNSTIGEVEHVEVSVFVKRPGYSAPKRVDPSVLRRKEAS